MTPTESQKREALAWLSEPGPYHPAYDERCRETALSMLRLADSELAEARRVNGQMAECLEARDAALSALRAENDANLRALERSKACDEEHLKYAKLMVARAEAAEAKLARLAEALEPLHTDSHQWSRRPCATCQKITGNLGRPFGCIRYAAEKALRETEGGAK